MLPNHSKLTANQLYWRAYERLEEKGFTGNFIRIKASKVFKNRRIGNVSKECSIGKIEIKMNVVEVKDQCNQVLFEAIYSNTEKTRAKNIPCSLPEGKLKLYLGGLEHLDKLIGE